MLRLRIKVIGWTHRVLTLTDTPRPDCPDCQGDGGTAHDYGDHNGEYAGTEWEPCPCWTQWAVILLPLPRWPRRTPPGYSDEPPF
ncbi:MULTISPECIES: hypothetical protein [Streptomyces]|uniref:Uncharacterized protein n=1 Tax=Streptomyces mooreae TaxID=3075523 RepID=A0ABU2TA14_9ACTN|nr:hypothetical protein [Streptomyces sp. DSM 41527]MDT0457789.1 hypothetical protein [Streptomyces sp. DSM 41527]WSV49013.1 hypothetical protein OG532_25950 [Streptomyces decoyicus]